MEKHITLRIHANEKVTYCRRQWCRVSRARCPPSLKSAQRASKAGKSWMPTTNFGVRNVLTCMPAACQPMVKQVGHICPVKQQFEPIREYFPTLPEHGLA
jgi:hypothetical protein